MVTSFPDVADIGAVQPEGERSAKFSITVSPLRSIQLRISPRLEVVRCGDMLSAEAGEDRGCGERDSFRQSVWLHPIATVAESTVTRYAPCFPIESPRMKPDVNRTMVA